MYTAGSSDCLDAVLNAVTSNTFEGWDTLEHVNTLKIMNAFILPACSRWRDNTTGTVPQVVTGPIPWPMMPMYTLRHILSIKSVDRTSMIEGY